MEIPKDFKINNFDLLRLFAATQVVIDHYFQQLKINISPFALEVLYLFPGVPIFFAISGYLISASYERNSNLINYARNRALRIFPGLWGCLIVTVVVISVTGVSFFNKQTIIWFPGQLLGIIYTPQFLNNYGFGSYNGSLWTIPVELQFYILLPLCYFLIPTKGRNYWLLTLIIIFITFNVLFQFINLSFLVNKLLSYSFIPNFYLFLIGVLFQRLRLYKYSFIYNKALFWIIAYITFSLSLPDFINPPIFAVIQHTFLAFCILSIAYTLPYTSKKLLKTTDISYGIYIYHGLILTVIVQEKFINSLTFGVLMVLTYILAYLSWTFIERPFIKRKKQTIRATQ